MCNGLTKSGAPCTRKAEWCKQHLSQKPIVAEPIVEQKNMEPELIEVAAEIVSENIVPPMSPNNILSSSSSQDPSIVVESNIAPAKKIFDERTCLHFRKGLEYQYWIDQCAVGDAKVSWRLRSPSGEFVFDTKNCKVLQVVQYVGKHKFRKYVWFYNHVDMYAFVKYFHGDSANRSCQFECHEVFVGKDPIIKLFFDIEQVTSTEFYNELKSSCGNSDAGVGEKICRDVMSALSGALEEFDHRFEFYESNIDHAIVSCIRAVGDNQTKISFHLITNVAMRVSECKAIVKVMKESYLGSGPDWSDEYMDLLCSKTTIDTNPYRLNGSLSLPGGRKNTHQLTTIREFAQKSMDLHLTNTDECNRYHDFSDELPMKSNQSNREAFEESSSEFIQKALEKLESDTKRVPAYDPAAMDLYANAPRGNYLWVARTAPSHCSECERTHDNADTLLLIFNEAKEIALWKCAHNEDMKARRWFGKSGQKEYEIDAHSDDDIEAFAQTLTTRAKKAEETQKAKQAEKVQEKKERMSGGEALFALPNWDIEIDPKTIPPINDIHNPCCYADYLKLQQKTISGEEAMEYIFKNFALILNGGESFFISKNFNKRANGARVVSYQYLKYKNIKNVPGSLSVKVANPDTKKTEIHSFSIFQLLIRWQSHIAYPEMRFSPFGAKLGYDWSQKDIFNTFTGFVHKYDSDFEVDETRIARFLAHIREAWCNDDEKLFEFTVKLFAYMVQFPHLKSAVAMIVMGPEGLGKNFVMNLWRDHVIGKSYFFETPSIDAITGKFNAMLEGNLMVVLNEAAKVNKSIEANRAQEVMKDIVTEETRRYERKGCEAYMGECFNNVICFSNNDYVVRASTEMRRFVFYKGSGRFIGQELEHFAPIKKDFEENDAGIHLYHYLMNIDLTGFHPQRSAPTTQAKADLQMSAIDRPIQWIIACLNREVRKSFINLEADHSTEEFYQSDTILGAYNNWLESCGEKSDATLKKLGKTLNKYFGDKLGRKRVGSMELRGYTISINEMKELISKTTRRNDLFDEDDE